MSFDAKTGHFILTLSNAILSFSIHDQDTNAMAARLREYGIEVYDICPAWVRCDMRPLQIWKAFHDHRPDPSLLASYWTNTAKALYPKWAAEEASEVEQAEVACT